MNALTSLSYPISQHSAVILDLFDDDQNLEVNRQAVVEHTTAIIGHLHAMQANALQMCVRMFLLSEEFSKTSEETWKSFCQKNFASFGLSDGGIRSAIRTGRAIFRLSHDESNAERIGMLASLSRAALFAFGDAPEDTQAALLEHVSDVVESRNGKGATAQEVNNLLERIKDMGDDLAEKADLIKAKDAALSRLTNALDAREEEAAQARAEIDKLHKKFANQAHAVVTQLPKGIKDAEELKVQIETEISNKKDTLSHLEREIDSLREGIKKQESILKNKATAIGALDALENDIKTLHLKYTDALVEKIRAADRANIQQLDRLANGLRALADTLSPALL